MARTINSPGVQIIETDLSNYQQFGGATTVFVPGFANQGPTDEVLLITSVAELEQTYGQPTTPAEKYFYYSAKEVLNSPATLLTTRLPYGSGSGADFSTQYSALLYPVTSGTDTFIIGQPKHITLNDAAVNKLLQNDFIWGNLPDTEEDASWDPTQEGSMLNAGIVVINTAQTTVNELFEGYYVSIADNTGFGASTPFDSVETMQGLSNTDTFYSVPETRRGFALSGSLVTAGEKSVSETIEFVPRFSFDNDLYKDSIVFTVFKVRNSIYEPQVLTYSLQEAYIGSLNPNKKTVQNDSTQSTDFIQSKINGRSPNVRMLINPKISEETNWADSNTINPKVSVTVRDNNKAMYAAGVYSPSYRFSSVKAIGSVVKKIERAFSLVESTENIDIDIVTDAGLTTIFATTNEETNPTFNDEKYIEQTDLVNGNSPIAERWRTLFNVCNTFAQHTRKDCVFIADPLRQIFINGNSKTMSSRTSTFQQNIYNPLKGTLGTINSNFSVIYGNWSKQYDVFTDTFIWLPISGHAAAVYAKTDRDTQPWFAPAGLNRAVLNNIVDLGFNPNQKQRDFLYTISVNPVVNFSRDGFVIFGQKTLQNKPSAFDRVNVRRLFLTLERATQKALKYFVFEPNTEFTRTRLKNTITPIFELAKNTQGVYEYLIVCDERNNTPDVIDRNELAVDIYLKPVKAAEFILVNFIATRTGQNFQELI